MVNLLRFRFLFRFRLCFAMRGPAALLRGGDPFTGRFAQDAFLTRLRGRGGRRVIDTGAKLAADVVDLRLNFIPLALKMMQRILEDSRVLVGFVSGHSFSQAHYIMTYRTYSE
jgi:hypothetical protein